MKQTHHRRTAIAAALCAALSLTACANSDLMREHNLRDVSAPPPGCVDLGQIVGKSLLVAGFAATATGHYMAYKDALGMMSPYQKQHATHIVWSGNTGGFGADSATGTLYQCPRPGAAPGEPVNAAPPRPL